MSRHCPRIVLDAPRRRTVFAIFVIVAALVSVNVAAQTTTGGIRGIVRDNTGGVLPGVTVTASSPALIGGTSVDLTTAQGQYHFEGLPIGIYSFKFTLQGFKVTNRENVRVEVGRTIDVDATMEVGGLEETLTVSAGAPVVDSLHAGTATTFNRELLESLPSARISWFNTVNFAPAMRADLENFGSANFIMYGGDVNQNSYQFEGIDYNAPSSSSMWDRPNPDTTQELQVKSVGTSAEEYGFLGGVVNMVVKEGSNTFRGMASEYYIGDRITSNNQPGVALPFRIGYLYDTTAMLGGRIVTDKLWFYGAVEDFRNKQVNPGVVLETAPKTRRDKPTVKVTARVSAHDMLDFAHTDNYHDIAPPATIQAPPVTAIKDTGNAPAVAGHWTHTFGGKTVLEVKGGGLHVNQLDPPHSGDFTNSGHFDLKTGIASVNAKFPSTDIQNNYTVAAALSHYADAFIHGSHDLKFGVQIVPKRSDLTSSLVINNIFFYDLNGAPYYALKRQPNAVAGSEKSQGVFVQDNWTFNDRATFNLGVRFDHTSEDVPEAAQYDAQNKPTSVVYPGIAGHILQVNTVSPRLGLTYKIDARGATVAKASYGRYYGRISMQNFDAMSPGNVISSYFYYNPATGQYDIPYFTVNPNGNYAVDPNLKDEYTDQFNLGLERQLAPSLGLELSFVAKRYGDFIRVVDATGQYVSQPYVDTLNGTTQVLTVYNRVTPSSQSLFTATNPPGYRQTFRTFIVSVNKRLSARWQLLSSYQYEDSEGNNGGAQGVASQAFSNTGPNGFGRDPNDLINSYGRFYTSNAHTVRASGSYEFPHGFSFALMESFESGRPYGRLVTVLGLNQGSRNVLAEPRGTYHLGSTNNIQLRVAKVIQITQNERIRLSIDAYNIFNTDTALTVQNNSTQRNYGSVLTIYTPRRLQLGVRYDF